MQVKITLIGTLLFLALFLIPHGDSFVHAEQDNKSVTDWVESNEKTADSQNEKTGSTESSDSDTPVNETTVSAWDFIKMILATAFVVFLIYVLLKFVNKKNKFGSTSRYIENLGGTNVGQNRSIQLVKVGKRILVVGVSDSVQLLKEIEDEDEYQEILEEHEQRLSPSIEPKDWMKSISGSILKYKKSEIHQPPSFSFKEQLDKLKSDRRSKIDDLNRKD